MWQAEEEDNTGRFGGDFLESYGTGVALSFDESFEDDVRTLFTNFQFPRDCITPWCTPEHTVVRTYD